MRPASLRPTRLIQGDTDEQTHDDDVNSTVTAALRPEQAPYVTSGHRQDIPEGSIQFWEFASAHKVKITTFRDYLRRGVPYIERAKPNRPREIGKLTEVWTDFALKGGNSI